MLPIYADSFENVGRVLLNLLAILGGFLLGNIVMMFTARLTARFVFHKPAPKFLEHILRLMGGVLGAVLVAMLVFGDGGWGIGGSGGGNQGGTGGDNKQQPANTNTNKDKPKEEPPKKETPKIEPKIDTTEKTITVRVEILGGSPDEDRYYLYEDDKEASTLPEVKNKIRTRADRAKLKRLEISIYKGSASRVTNIVKNLETFAQLEGLEPSYPPVEGNERPKR